MNKQNCPHCRKTYASEKWLLKHLEKCEKNVKMGQGEEIVQKKPKASIKIKRKAIDSRLRKNVWDTYIGQKTSGKCFCCRENEITAFTYCNTFQAGHIISHMNGGKAEISNLLPICRDCNMKMSSENWDDYVERHSHLPMRRCGANPPIAKYMKGIIWTQSLARMYLERKKPDSHWRIEWRRRWLTDRHTYVD